MEPVAPCGDGWNGAPRCIVTHLSKRFSTDKKVSLHFSQEKEFEAPPADRNTSWLTPTDVGAVYEFLTGREKFGLGGARFKSYYTLF